MSGRRGGAIQLSGSLEVVRRHGEFVLRPLREHTSPSAPGVAVQEWPLDGSERRLGRWRFVPLAGRADVDDDLWQARLPAGGQPVTVREWQAGDRVRGDDGVAARRVKRFFKDRGIAGVDRSGWPVALLGGDVVWIPGIRRTAAATVPSGRPGVSYACLRACDRDHD